MNKTEPLQRRMSICCISNPKTRFRTKHELLKQLHIYSILIAQIIASAILIALLIWLFIRFPEPQVHLTGFTVDALDKSNTMNRTLLHYNLTLHNPDLYKSLIYDVLFLRMTFSGYHSTAYGATINFNLDGKGIHQGPGETTLLANHTVNYTDSNVGWVPEDLIELKTIKEFIKLRFVLEVRFMAFKRVMIGRRQLMRTADVYFDDNGKAFINPRRGLTFD